MNWQASGADTGTATPGLGRGFCPRRSPVALRLVADSVLATPASVVRHTDRLSMIASTSDHLSIAIEGSTAKRHRLADHLHKVLQYSEASLLISTEPPTASDVLPRCPLLSTERGDCEWSGSRLNVPHESAWFPECVVLTEYLSDDGILDRERLAGVIDGIVDAAEACFDTARWPTPGMQQDAWMNRRLAIRLVGYPVLHERYRYTMSALHQLTGWVSARLQSRSEWHASRRRPLPAILGADPTRGMPLGEFRDEWLRRWWGAVDSTAVRHRNLLALEVDALAYRSLATGRINTELLPLIVHADVTGLACSLPLAEDECHSLAQCVRASLQQRHALDQIAKHV
ncbi:MAG: hypothetical protein QNJ19_09115 [Woeseiaceae bacterium]|nr:hypothetical protein [Woeseiaceae bacterium]